MSATVIATPEGPTSNAYATEAETTAYLETRPNSASWTDGSADDKARAVITATWLMESLLDYTGSITTLEQALNWPRSGVSDREGRYLDQDTVPALIKRAMAELALYLLVSDRLADPGVLGQGFSQAKLGSMEVTVDPSQVLAYIPGHIIAMLDGLASLRPDAARGGDRIVPLVRA